MYALLYTKEKNSTDITMIGHRKKYFNTSCELSSSLVKLNSTGSAEKCFIYLAKGTPIISVAYEFLKLYN